MIKKFSTDQSSVIKEIAYNSETHNMRITFKSGSIYVYESVPENVFNEFITSESLGKYFGMYIKNRYFYKNIVAAASTYTPTLFGIPGAFSVIF